MTPFHALVEAVPDGLTWHDPAGRYLYVSPGFRGLLGFERDELLGVSPYDLFHADDIPRIGAVHEEALASGRPFRTSYRIRRADATYLWVESAGRFVPEGADNEPGIAVATRDIEARTSLLSALEHERAARDRLAELAERQRASMTAIAHRTRTPMTAVLGFAQTLAKHGDALAPSQVQALLQRLVVNAARLADVIDQTTLFERTRRGDWLVRRRPVTVAQLAADVAREVADLPDALEIDVPADLVVMADEDMLRRALRVLLHNAIVHTPPGTQLWVRGIRGDGHVDITVEDAGPGIRDELKEVVFEPFALGDSQVPHDPSVGLGLSLVATIAAEHDGRVWVEDREGGGAVFRLRLPDGD